MIRNIGVLDGVFRILVGSLLLAWSYGEFDLVAPQGRVGDLIWGLGLVFLLTGILRYSPVYSVFRLNSCAANP